MTDTQTQIESITQTACQTIVSCIARGIRGIHEHYAGSLRVVLMLFSPSSWEVVVFQQATLEIYLLQEDEGTRYERHSPAIAGLSAEVQAAIIAGGEAWM